MKIILNEGDKLEISFEGGDGNFIVDYNLAGTLSIESELEDDNGRKGIVWFENFGYGDDGELCDEISNG